MAIKSRIKHRYARVQGSGLHFCRLLAHPIKAKMSSFICSLVSVKWSTQQYLSQYVLIGFQSISVPASVVTVTPVKPVNTVTTLKPSDLGASSVPSNEPGSKAERSAAAQVNLSPVSSYWLYTNNFLLVVLNLG